MTASLPRFLQGSKIAPYVGGELSEKLANPLIFQWTPVVVNDKKPPSTPIYGYDVTILIDICKAVIKAEEEGNLLNRQKRIARQAHVIVNASAKAGIKGLVYALAGYDPSREEVVAAFKFFVREEAREYEKEFPDQLYNEWYRLYQLPKPAKNKPWKFKELTVIISRLRGVILENRPALELIRRFDGDQTLFYADPPYLPETRASLRDHGHKHSYKHEMTRVEHEELAAELRHIRGVAVVSGYGSALYDRLYQGWATVRFDGAQSANQAGAKPQEVLWLNRQIRTLFD